jgi:hypothetical protein
LRTGTGTATGSEALRFAGEGAATPACSTRLRRIDHVLEALQRWRIVGTHAILKKQRKLDHQTRPPDQTCEHACCVCVCVCVWGGIAGCATSVRVWCGCARAKTVRETSLEDESCTTNTPWLLYFSDQLAGQKRSPSPNVVRELSSFPHAAHSVPRLSLHRSALHNSREPAF